MNDKLVKSPMNYVGGKYKLLPQILPLFPKNIDTFVDLFCGGFNVGINVKANKIIGNDICKEVVDIYRGIQQEGQIKSLELIKQQIDKYELSKTNEEGFRDIRTYYNNGNKEWYVFYSLLTHAFNYQIEFNKKREYNTPFGRNRSWFNPRMENNFRDFAKEIENKNIIFDNTDFTDFNFEELTNNDFVYLDPPYLLAYASYNKRNGWTQEKEVELLKLCNRLNSKGIRFALSNVIKHKGKTNDILIKWSEKYNVHYLNYNYNSCNYQKYEYNKGETIEVLITNY